MSRFSWDIVLIGAGISLMATACEDAAKHPASVEFLVDIAGGSGPGHAFNTLADLADAAALVVSVEDASGAVVYDSERVELYSFNGTFLSHPLSLPPGTYALTEFLVVDASGSVLHATPVEGSAMAHLVVDPLAISFGIGKDVVTTIRPEVLSTEAHTPEDFGYVSFEPIVVDVIDFLVAALVYDPNTRTLVLTTASIQVEDEHGERLYAGDLGALTNKISVPDDHAEYRVTITKPGYEPYNETFTADELGDYFDGMDNGPLSVVLEESEEEVPGLASCNAILEAGMSAGDGLYTIDPDGPGTGLEPFEVYCDMSHLGGGWTLFGYHTRTNDVVEANPVAFGVEGALSDERWQALRDRMTHGMMFIDHSGRVSMISLAKLLNGNCSDIMDVPSLVNHAALGGRLWHRENSGCGRSGLDYSLVVMTKHATYGASLYQYSSTRFDVWPYTSAASYNSTGTLGYFLK